MNLKWNFVQLNKACPFESPPSKTNVRVSINEDLQVHKFSELTVDKGHYTLKDDDIGSVHCHLTKHNTSQFSSNSTK